MSEGINYRDSIIRVKNQHFFEKIDCELVTALKKFFEIFTLSLWKLENFLSVILVLDLVNYLRWGIS